NCDDFELKGAITVTEQDVNTGSIGNHSDVFLAVSVKVTSEAADAGLRLKTANRELLCSQELPTPAIQKDADVICECVGDGHIGPEIMVEVSEEDMAARAPGGV